MRRHDARQNNRRYLVTSLILGFFIIIVSFGFLYMAAPKQQPQEEEMEQWEENDTLEVSFFSKSVCNDVKIA